MTPGALSVPWWPPGSPDCGWPCPPSVPAGALLVSPSQLVLVPQFPMGADHVLLSLDPLHVVWILGKFRCHLEPQFPHWATIVECVLSSI